MAQSGLNVCELGAIAEVLLPVATSSGGSGTAASAIMAIVASRRGAAVVTLITRSLVCKVEVSIWSVVWNLVARSWRSAAQRVADKQKIECGKLTLKPITSRVLIIHRSSCHDDQRNDGVRGGCVDERFWSCARLPGRTERKQAKEERRMAAVAVD